MTQNCPPIQSVIEHQFPGGLALFKPGDLIGLHLKYTNPDSVTWGMLLSIDDKYISVYGDATSMDFVQLDQLGCYGFRQMLYPLSQITCLEKSNYHVPQGALWSRLHQDLGLIVIPSQKIPFSSTGRTRRRNTDK